MKFIRNASALVTAFSILTASVTPVKARADESISQILNDRTIKEDVTKFLRKRWVKHHELIESAKAKAAKKHRDLSPGEKLEIANSMIADYMRDAGKTTKFLLDHGRREEAVQFDKTVQDQAAQYALYADPELILHFEDLSLTTLYQSEQYMLYIMNHVSVQLSRAVCSCDDQTLSIVFAIFLVPLDIIAFPVELIMTLVTGA